MNPFNCNCSILWLRNMLAREESIIDALDVKCGMEPLHWNGLLVRDIPSHYDSVCKGSNYGEQFCSSKSKFPCTTSEPVNTCIHESKMCDGANDCANSLDESPYVCNGRQPYAERVTDSVAIQRPAVFGLFNGLLDHAFHVPLMATTAGFGSLNKPCR